jgi:ABC-type nitrate/sulfonate/bicarbonate transport system substrate-binding protein
MRPVKWHRDREEPMDRAYKAALAALIAFSCGASAQADEAVKVTVPVINTTFAPVFVALEKGYFKAEGLDVELVRIGGSGATSALIAGSVDYSGSPSSALSAVVKGADLRVVLINSGDPQFTLWSFDPGVTNVDGLRGKSVAIVTRGDTMEIAMRMFLKGRNLPADYVGFTALGDDGGRIAAIASGAQRYALLLRADVPRLRDMGVLKEARQLVDFGREFEMPTGGLAVAGKTLEAHPDRTKRFLRAVRKGVAYVKAFKAETVAVIQKRLPGASAEALAIDLDGTLSTMTPDGTMSLEAAARELAIRGELLGVAPDKIPSAPKIFDFSHVREANREIEASAWRPAP